MTQVRHYGLHTTEANVVYLHQGGHRAHNFIQLPKASPFEVVFDGKRKPLCPHNIDVSGSYPDRNHWEVFLDLFNDDLVKEFLPIPKSASGNATVYVDDPQGQLHNHLLLLSKLSSPTISLVYPFSGFNKSKFLEAMTSTNVAPLVLTGVESSDQKEINELVREAVFLPRKLILAGAADVVVRDPMYRRKTIIDRYSFDTLLTLPWESLGTVALRRWCRGEQINTPIRKD